MYRVFTCHGFKEYTFTNREVIYNSQDLEAAQEPISRTVNKKSIVHLHNGIPLCHKKGNLTFCNNMDGPGEHYA